MLAILAALASALLVAVASVLQHQAGAGSPPPRLRHVLRRPTWLSGAVAGLAGFALHLIALSHGALSVVQPLLVSGLLFALPLGRALQRRPIRTADVAAAGVVVGGLALFQFAGRPSAGRVVADTAALGWCTCAGVSAVAIVLLAVRGRPAHRALWLGLCAGAAYGVVAALLKSALGVFTLHGVGALLGAWPLYAFVVLVCAAIALNQLAFNAGPLAHSLPLITIVDPLVSIVIGALAFGESIASDPILVLGQILGFVAMSIGIVSLSRHSDAQSTTADAVPSPARRAPRHAAPTLPPACPIGRARLRHRRPRRDALSAG